MFGRIKPYFEWLAAPRAAFRQRPAPVHRGDPVKNHISSWQARFLWSGIRPMGPFSLSRAGPDPFLAEASLYSEAYHWAAVAFRSAQRQDVREGVSQKLLASRGGSPSG